jgi:hypothetical protein
MSSLSITVPGFVTVMVPCTTVSFVPGGTPVFVGPGLPAGSGAVGDAVAVGFGFGFGVGVGLTVGFGVGLGLTVGFAEDFEADGEEVVAAGADVDDGAVEKPWTTGPGTLETDDGGPGSVDAADELAGATDCVELDLFVGARSMMAATISPPSRTSTSVTTTRRSLAEPGMAARSL